MPTEIKCPECGSDKTMAVPDSQAFLCYTCKHEFTPEKPFVPQRIFLSYGHDEHVSLAIHLRDDLLSRKHTVWFDEERLQPGHDWEVFIEQGLEHLAADKANAAVILLLTPHSVRRPDGYCLNEVARALSHGLRIIPLMVVESEPPLSICRIQWLDMRECIPIHEKEALYRPRYERLLKALEEDAIDFQGVQSHLLRVLQPIQFSSDLLKLLRGFTGRQWVFDEIDAWFANPDGSKIFWLTGAPGVGKSAVAAWVREHRRQIAAFHFCDISSEEKRNPAKLVCSIAYQLSTQLPEYEARLAALDLESIVAEYREAYTLFDKLLVQPLADGFPAPDRTVVVLIDALDEATHDRRNEIVRFLGRCAEKTPPWLRFLVTSRPEPEIESSFQRLSPHVLNTGREENLEDLRAYLAKNLPGITPDQIREIVRRSEGVFLYVAHVVEAVRNRTLSLQRLDEFPRGLGDVFQQFFERQFGGDLGYYEEKITPLLQAIFAAREPLALAHLKAVCGIPDRTELDRRLNRLGSLFPTGGEEETIRPFHRSLRDWITERRSAGHFVIAEGDGHRLLASNGWREFEEGPEKMEGYSLSWLPTHLKALSDDQRLVRVLKNFHYLMEKIRRGMLERLLADNRELPARLTGARGGLEIEASFFREKAHILRRGNQEWPAYKILLQLAVEHADDSPLTGNAEQWIAEGRCDWLWLRRVPRLQDVQVKPCLVVFEGHTWPVKGAMALADGRLLSWSWDYTLRLWDAQSGECLTVFEGHTNEIRGAQSLRDGQLFSWSKDNTVRIWDCENGVCMAVLKGHTGPINGALALADGRIVSWADDKTIRYWSGSGGLCLAVLEGHADSVLGARMLADGRLLSWSGDRMLRVWDGQSGKCKAVLRGHTRAVGGAEPLDDGRLLSWSWDNTLRVWDGQSGECLAILEGHSHWVRGAGVLADGRLLSWSSDRTLRLWDSQSGVCMAVLEEHSHWVMGAYSLPDGRLLSWSNDGTLRFWDSNTGACLNVLEGHTDGVRGAQVLPDGHVLSWSGDSKPRLWHGVTGACIMEFEGHTDAICGAQALVNGNVLSWSDDKTLRLWTSQNRPCWRVLEGNQSMVCGVTLLSTGGVLSWSDDKILRLWDSQCGKCVKRIQGHTARVAGAHELRDGRLLSWSWDSTLRSWDGKSGECGGVLEGHIDVVLGAQQLHDGRLLSWSRDRTLRLWDSRSWKCIAVLDGHSDSVLGALSLADGRLLSWSADKTLRLWDGKSGVCMAVLEGHTKSIVGVEPLDNGRLLSWSWDNTLRLWDAQSGKNSAVLEGHMHWVKRAQVLADGRLLSWSSDKTLRLWDGQSGAFLAVLEGHTGSVRGALALADGLLLSWSQDQTLRLWDAQSGACLETVSEDAVARLHPDWLYERVKAETPDNIFLEFFMCSPHRSTHLRHKTIPMIICAWNADSDTNTHCLLPDGTTVVTQDNGEVCILKLHHGNHRISLAEAQSLLPRLRQVGD